MAISRLVASSLLFVALTASAREAATPAACQAAGTQPPISDAKVLAANSGDLRASFKLADAWSDAGCFNEALQVLSAAAQSNPGNKELGTRLRVARSVVGEEHFFENLDRANDQARLKRATFRCTSLADAAACGEAVRLRPDDASLWSAQGDALMHSNRAAEALTAYKRAASINPEQPNLSTKIAAAQSQTPPASVLGSNAGAPLSVARISPAPRPALRLAREAPRKLASYSNIEPESHSH